LAATGEEMENENQPMDSDARTDAALAAFNGDDGQQQQDDSQAQAQDDGQQQADGQQQQDDQQQQQQQDGQITDEQLQADPRYTELTDFRDNVVNALQEFPGLVDDKGMPNMNEAALQLRDASVLYDIMQGKGTPSALLEVMGQNANWTPEQKQAIAQDLIGWLTKGGFLKDGQAAQPQAGAKDPVTARLDKIENERKTEQQRQEQQRVQTHQKQVFDTKFLPKVKELAKQKGVPEEDFADYATRVAGMINGNKAILARIEKGNFVDVQKFFTQVFNAEAARLQRWTKAQTAAAQKKTQNPRIPAGGAPPAPAGSAKPINAKSREDRIAAAADML
jgi:hypothetical protein